MMNKILKIIAVAQAVAFSAVNVQKANEPIKGYQIYEGQYVSEIFIGDISHDYIGVDGYWGLGNFKDPETNKNFIIAIWVNGGIVENPYIENGWSGLIDWEKSGLNYDNTWRYTIPKTNFCLYLKKPLKAYDISERTNLYLSYTSPAQTFAAGYDGFIPSYYYTSILGNESYFSDITSVSSLITGQIWKSGDVSSLGIENNGFIIQNYYVYASVEEAGREYDVWLRAPAKKDNKLVDLNIAQLVYVNLNENKRRFKSYDFPDPVPTLEAKSGYYNIIRSGGAYGLTESIKNYEEGYKDGQGNPTFKSFIVSAFEACSSFFSLPVLGEHITIGTLIGSFVGLGALFLIIKLFR